MLYIVAQIGDVIAGYDALISHRPEAGMAADIINQEMLRI
jgi:hypothetical protein